MRRPRHAASLLAMTQPYDTTAASTARLLSDEMPCHLGGTGHEVWVSRGAAPAWCKGTDQHV
jgi:hypothetical protein